MSAKKLKELEEIKKKTLEFQKKTVAQQAAIKKNATAGIAELKKVITKTKGDKKVELQKALKQGLAAMEDFEKKTIESKAYFKGVLASLNKDIKNAK